MKTYATILMAGALVLVMSITAAAQYDEKSQQAAPATDVSRTVEGTVVSVNASSLVIRTAAGDQMTFDRDATMMIPSTVSVGSSVRVEYTSPEVGMFHLSSVMVNPNPSSATAPSQYSPSTSPAYPAGTSSPSEPMPRTASPLPVVGLLGLFALAGGWALRSMMRG